MKPYLNKVFGILALAAGFVSFSAAAETPTIELIDTYPQPALASQENQNSYRAELQHRMASMSDEERKLLQSMNEMRQQDRASQNNESGKKNRQGKKDGKGSGKKHRKGQNSAQGYKMGYANARR